MSDQSNGAENPKAFHGNLLEASDNDLAFELMQKNHEALAVLIDRYQRLVFTIAVRIVRDPGEAEDVAQIVFLEIFRKAKSFEPDKGPFRGWLLRYAYTRSMDRRDQLECRRFYTSLGLDEAGALEIPSRDFFSGSFTEQEVTVFVQQALDSLNSNQRKVVDSIALEGRTLKETAEVLGHSLAATKNYYYRGIMGLRACNTSRSLSPAIQTIDGLAVENGNRGVQHLKPREA